ncbi:MAG: DNA gyrase subunit A, partial [Limisphaerales bacterium]
MAPRETTPTSSKLGRRMDTNFLEYASYVIRDRAIPSLDDGLKPVQRRIMWSLNQNDDGKFIKVANIVGHCMQYHPHGDASISDALVVLTNKQYLIEGQGNFGNLFTGDPAAASRYIECRLTPLARTQLFNDELTEFVPSYDGRNKEPVSLPSKLPMLLMLGAEGIAVGLSAKILPHNFCELLEAQIAILRKQPFTLLPDFPAGGLMD